MHVLILQYSYTDIFVYMRSWLRTSAKPVSLNSCRESSRKGKSLQFTNVLTDFVQLRFKVDTLNDFRKIQFNFA